MLHVAVAFALLGHVLFWGAGAAVLLAPRPWRRFWPVLLVPAGLALQSAVVWLGAHTGLRGTDAYAGWSELLPASLLALALARRGARALAADLGRFGLVLAAASGALLLLVAPLAVVSPSLTTISLGSCDAPDYAAGARVLQEFARTDRAGFLGLTEVVRVHSVDNFFDFWLRLNHFTPSALIALNASTLRLSPPDLTTLLTAVLLAGGVPAAFWAARAVIGYHGAASLLIASLFGLSPVMWYAVAHVAPGQLLAAQAVALLNWAGIALWRGRLSLRRAGQFGGVLAIGYWLVLGSYNFFLLACLIPSLAYAGSMALWRRDAPRFAAWLGAMLLPLAGVALPFSGRIAGLAERFALFQTYDFGWRIPALTAEGWLGLVQGPDLAPWSVAGLRWLLCAVVIGLLVWAWLRAARQRHPGLWVVAALTLPTLVGYSYLQYRGARLGTNASYDAYKLLAVFYPLLLPALCWWVTLRRSRRLHEWILVASVGAVVAAFNLAGAGMFAWSMSHPPLRVDAELRQLRAIEGMPDVRSVNLLIPDMWSRLWANSLLLRRPQYFETHTYEGRLNTPLRGDWDLVGGLVSVTLPPDSYRPVARRFALVDTRASQHLRVRPGEGWHPVESHPGLPDPWQWAGREAVIELENPHPDSRRVRCRLEARGLGPRTLSIRPPDGAPTGPAVHLGPDRATVDLGLLEVPPGRSRWVIESAEPAVRLSPSDPREVALCVYRLALAAGGN